mgnify:CR=1 FL=1
MNVIDIYIKVRYDALMMEKLLFQIKVKCFEISWLPRFSFFQNRESCEKKLKGILEYGTTKYIDLIQHKGGLYSNNYFRP